jgi:hypothetical protein
MKLYIDGVKDPSEKERLGPLDVNTNSVLIGKPQYAFNGLIDEVRIYSRALSEEEIKGLFQDGAALMSSKLMASGFQDRSPNG